MARSEGLALAPWGVLGQGRIYSDADAKRRKESGEKGRTMYGPDWERNPNEVKVSQKLEEVAKEAGAKSVTAVALAYVMHVGYFYRHELVFGISDRFHGYFRKHLTFFLSSEDGKWNNSMRTLKPWISV